MWRGYREIITRIREKITPGPLSVWNVWCILIDVITASRRNYSHIDKHAQGRFVIITCREWWCEFVNWAMETQQQCKKLIVKSAWWNNRISWGERFNHHFDIFLKVMLIVTCLDSCKFYLFYFSDTILHWNLLFIYNFKKIRIGWLHIHLLFISPVYIFNVEF